MPFQQKVVIARPLDDIAREVRIIRALYPQECLSPSLDPMDPDPIAASLEALPTYHNTGVQTLPPANGNIFRLIHGCEPSQSDYVHSMGSAGIGRLAADPRSNLFDLIYGSTYLAPTTATRGTYTESGFQTANHDTRRKALARAKVKASMTANKYRNAASKAGYVIYAESRDEMVVHSEQFHNVIQLDSEGNLLEGTVKTRNLPNIYGALIYPEPSETPTTRGASEQAAGRLPKQSRDKERCSRAPQAPYPSPSQSPLIPPLATAEELQSSVAIVSALAPAMKHSPVEPTLDNEYGSGETGTTDFIVYNASAEHSRPELARSGTKQSSGKRKSTEHSLPDYPCKKHKILAQASPRRSSISVAPLAVGYPSQQEQDRNIRPMTSESAFRASPRFQKIFCTRPGEFGQERTLNVVQASTKWNIRSESITSSSTDTFRVQELKPWRMVSHGRAVGNMDVAAGTETGIHLS
ncbi:uncharacterized protein M421DRAFT_8223 [Didymella exigua CBS 183.55]|uniref:Uncharacterized protein n=1 Tax=Didymella exigua CBS 183.55 TaxID=1150837 RepID=A0A6A5RCP8_9PLEO|nr:uncharacterized protein M421DRAFT_8223 [Didymella exigua CBS 183.55]KAF1925159.1 hypothetical protein M421DRAFT_8223 [Didymella exigua CBS 183.55]